MAEHANGYLTPRKGVSQGAEGLSAKKYVADAKPALGSVAQPSVACHERRFRTMEAAGLRQQASGQAPRYQGSPQGEATPPLGSVATTGSYLMPGACSLSKLDGGACLLELVLQALRVLAADALAHGVRRLVHERLGLLKTEAGRGAHHLDDLDLLVPRRLEHDVELGLLLLGRGARAVAGRSAGRRGGRYRARGDAEALLECLHQLGELENRHVLDSLHQLFLVYRHNRSSSDSTCYLRLRAFLLGDLVQRDYQTLDGVVEHVDQPRERGGDAADHLGEQLLAPGEPAEGYDLGLVQYPAALQESALQGEGLHLVRELGHQLGARDRVLREGQGRRPHQVLREVLHARLARGAAGGRDVRDLAPRVGLPAGRPELGAPGHVHPLVVH